MPIQIGLYPFLKLEHGALVVRGTSAKPAESTSWPPQISAPAHRLQLREGYRWGMSATWDQQTPHYMLPAELVIEQPPKNGSLYVTGAQMFDYVYDTEDFIRSLSSDRHARRSEKSDLETHVVTWDKGMVNFLYQDSCAEAMVDIRHSQQLDTPPGVEYRFNLMAKTLAWLPRDRFASVFFCLDMKIIGFALCWIEPATSTCFFVQRGFYPLAGVRASTTPWPIPWRSPFDGLEGRLFRSQSIMTHPPNRIEELARQALETEPRYAAKPFQRLSFSAQTAPIPLNADISDIPVMVEIGALPIHWNDLAEISGCTVADRIDNGIGVCRYFRYGAGRRSSGARRVGWGDSPHLPIFVPRWAGVLARRQAQPGQDGDDRAHANGRKWAGPATAVASLSRTGRRSRCGPSRSPCCGCWWRILGGRWTAMRSWARSGRTWW